MIGRESLNQALEIRRQNYPLISVKSFKQVKAGPIITGSEVDDGLIEDRVEAIVEKKLTAYGSTLIDTDNQDLMLAHRRLCLNCPACRFPSCSFGKIG